MARITVVIPKAHVPAIRDALRSSHAAISEEVQDLRATSQRSPALTCHVKRLAELCSLLDQLADDTREIDRAITGDYGPLRTAACDALVTAIEQLDAVAHSYWRHDASAARLDDRLQTVTERVELLSALRAANDDPPATAS